MLNPERIAVFRALMLGDLLCATPALRALRQAWPRAEITLVGLPWAAALAERLSSVDRFVPLPGFPGLPEMPCDVQALPSFLAGMQGRRFDLAVQLHGSGRIVNNLVALFGAQHMAGFADDQAWVPPGDASHFVPWPVEGQEIDRLLSLTTHLGAPPAGRAIEFPLRPEDDAALESAWTGIGDVGRFVCVHPGSQLPSRRWPAQRFAAVADVLAERGYTIVLTGSAGEREVVDEVRAAMRSPAVDLCGATTLWSLGALIRRADRIVSNDTSVSHMAAAFGTASVVISNGADAPRWAPFDARLHRVLWAPVPCRPCAHAVCPVDNACAKAVEVAHVLARMEP